MDSATNDALCAFIARKVMDVLEDCARIDDCEYSAFRDRFTCKLHMDTLLDVNGVQQKLEANYHVKDVEMSATPSFIHLGFTGAWWIYEDETSRFFERRNRQRRPSTSIVVIVGFLLLSCMLVYVFER